ncbi:leucyl aminopeptidase family protein [Pseudorhodoplanes sinuspersici]|uniref:Leucyl aminopeptidase n=1 Tax=Pseudorhodoplanes sinuspersici TaxID=1235591 RepID=A0A1W6ZNT5_9HYPH|nr:leucyl aminopeptidase family protein [Pseudorhodoplanes sinuspersici]ARP98790.1 leucyl aminopeptidase [Pseudorhodoplanes sinuspersici]RKE69592.1 leucyl aminopeptidase [Pseudorhodoplanes sinuspersici]
MQSIFTEASPSAIPIWFVTKATWPEIRANLPMPAQAFAEAAGFEPKTGRTLAVPSADGSIAAILFGIEKKKADANPLLPGNLPGLLPAGTYRFANDPHDPRIAALAFAFGSYRFERYRKPNGKEIKLVPPHGTDVADLTRIVEGVFLARDLINTPSNDMGPAELHEATRLLAERHDAWIEAVTDDELLLKNFPLIHAVGRASSRPPRLIDLRWGNRSHPKVTLVGKGVCFDTGGLDLKPESAMLLMKKDMGGAAAVLALAHMIMDRKLPVSLRVLIPAVENSVSGSAFRPLDIYPSRKGITVEVGNTDAEGRLVLADALTLADEEEPDLLVDMGTLTGAARVALGPELPPFYTGDDELAAAVAKHAIAERDPLWRMPLWAPYESMLDSKVADTSNVGGSFAGSITCALFLKKFVSAAKSWLHVDIYGWTPSAKPGRPEGGECQAARAVYALLCERYG